MFFLLHFICWKQELVNTQELPTVLEATLHKLKQVSEKYSSKSALGKFSGTVWRLNWRDTILYSFCTSAQKEEAIKVSLSLSIHPWVDAHIQNESSSSRVVKIWDGLDLIVLECFPPFSCRLPPCEPAGEAARGGQLCGFERGDGSEEHHGTGPFSLGHLQRLSELPAGLAGAELDQAEPRTQSRGSVNNCRSCALNMLVVTMNHIL